MTKESARVQSGFGSNFRLMLNSVALLSYIHFNIIHLHVLQRDQAIRKQNGTSWQKIISHMKPAIEKAPDHYKNWSIAVT